MSERKVIASTLAHVNLGGGATVDYAPIALMPDVRVVKIGGQSIMDRGRAAVFPVLDELVAARKRGVPIVVLPFVSDALASRPPFKRSVQALRAEGVSILLGPGGVPPHPAHGESDAMGAFPWHLALDEAAEMTGFGGV